MKRAMTPAEARYYRDLGIRIRIARERRGWTQEQLARMVERRTGPAVHYWEQGINSIDPYTLRRLERVLGEELYA